MTHDPSSPSHSTALPTVRVVPLRWWLPLALVFTCVLAFALLVLQQQRHYTLDLQRFSDRTAHAELLGTQRNLETVLRREDGSGLDGVIAELGLNPAVAHALLLDASDEVLAATRFAWRGSLGTQVLPHYPQDLVSKARQEQREQLRLDIEQRHLWAVTPVMLALEAGAIRSSRQGVLLVEYDLTPIAVQSSAHIRQQAQVFAAVVLLAALCLLMLARWGVMRPVNALRASMARIGAGDFTAVPALRGEGEFQELGQALGHMAQELQHSSQALRESEARFRQLSDVAFEAIFLHSGGPHCGRQRRRRAFDGRAPRRPARYRYAVLGGPWQPRCHSSAHRFARRGHLGCGHGRCPGPADCCGGQRAPARAGWQRAAGGGGA